MAPEVVSAAGAASGVKGVKTKEKGVKTKEKARFVCFPCKRKFPTATSLEHHEQVSDLHQRTLAKREDQMRKRKNEIIMAVRNLRQRICDADEALESQVMVNESVQNQRMVLEMQLQQLLGEYGRAQQIMEMGREAREVKQQGGEEKAKVHEARVGRLALTAGCACWQSNKDVQEDRFILDLQVESPDGHLIAGFAVLDGHSGSLCVDFVVNNFEKHLQRCLSSKQQFSEEILSQVVTEACATCDEEFLKTARKGEHLDGSTMVLSLVYPEDAGSNRAPGSCRLLIAWVGDSRAVMCQAGEIPGQDAQQLMAVGLSEDHKPNRPDEQRRVEAKGGVIDFQGVWRVFTPGPCRFGGQVIQRWGLAVSRSFGDLLLKEAQNYGCAGVAPGGLVTAVPELRVMDLQPGRDRFLILASDGVWDVISNEDAAAICAAEPTCEAAAQSLLRRTYAANSDDNLTAVVLTWRTID